MIGRLAKPEEVANLCVYLASDEVSHPVLCGEDSYCLDGKGFKNLNYMMKLKYYKFFFISCIFFFDVTTVPKRISIIFFLL